jgi:hypothetical protein
MSMRSLRNGTLCFLAILFLVPQIFSQQWVKTFNGSANGDDKVTNAVTDRAGNIYVTGYATRNGTGIDFCTIKYNSAGSVQWTKYYNGPGNGEDKAFGIAVDNSLNVYVTGYSKGTGSLASYTTIKYNSSGTELWVARYNTPANNDDRAFGVAVDNAGYVYVTGYVTLANPDIYTVKYNPNGVFLWGQTLTGTGNGEDKAFGIVSDGLNIFVTGYVKDSVGDFDIATVKYDSSGVVKWSKTYDGPADSDDRAFGIVVDNSRSYIYVEGYSTGIGTGTDATLLKYQSGSGDLKWVARYNGSANSDDKAFGLAVDNSGNCFVTGSTTGISTGSDYLTLKYNSSGVRQWTATYNNLSANSEDVANSIVLSNHSKFAFVTGASRSDTSSGSEDIVTIKYDMDNGEQTQINKYAGPDSLSDVGVKIVADTSDNIFVAAYTKRIATGYDWISYKFVNGDIIDVNVISTQVPREYRLYQNFPNPFNPSTKIRFDIKKSGDVKLFVYDVLGRQQALLVNKFLRTGTYEAELNLPQLSSGIYFYELQAPDYREVRKMVLIK